MNMKAQEKDIWYVTFGSAHHHELNGRVFDKDCIAVVRGTRKRIFQLFGCQFCFDYRKSEFDENSLEYFKRGFVEAE